MPSFINMQDCKDSPEWKLFQELLAIEVKAENSFGINFSKCIGLHHCDQWACWPLPESGKPFMLEYKLMYDNAHRNNVADCFCFPYHEGFVFYFARDWSHLKDRLKEQKDFLLRECGKGWLAVDPVGSSFP